MFLWGCTGLLSVQRTSAFRTGAYDCKFYTSLQLYSGQQDHLFILFFLFKENRICWSIKVCMIKNSYNLYVHGERIKLSYYCSFPQTSTRSWFISDIRTQLRLRLGSNLSLEIWRWIPAAAPGLREVRELVYLHENNVSKKKLFSLGVCACLQGYWIKRFCIYSITEVLNIFQKYSQALLSSISDVWLGMAFPPACLHRDR